MDHHALNRALAVLLVHQAKTSYVENEQSLEYW